MTGLLAGIKSKFTASLLASITGGLYPGDASEATAMPYATYRVVVPGFDQAYAGGGSTTSEVAQVQFDVVGEDENAVGVLCEFLASTYRSGVTASAGTNYHVSQTTACFPDPEPLGKIPDGTKDVWRWSVTLEFATC